MREKRIASMTGEALSPLSAFVTTLTMMAEYRRMLLGMMAPIPSWLIALDDIEMMLHENVIHGLHTPWVRRVAVPVFQAYKELAKNSDDKEHAKLAMEILDQCTDTTVRTTCQEWIKAKYHV